MKNTKKAVLTPQLIFILVSSLCFFVTLLRLLSGRGAAFEEIFDVNGYFAMCDTIMHIVFVDTPAQVYQAYDGCCFPPFAYLFYLLLNRILPASADGTVSMNHYQSMPVTMLVLWMIILVLSVILSHEIHALLQNSAGIDLLISFLILLSEPFWAGAIERGNSVYVALVLVILALLLKDHPNRIYRELALICIAMAAGFKIYPAIIGILYLKEKRYREAGHLVIYGILVAAVPFLFFGGFEGFKELLSNLSSIAPGEGGSIYSIPDLTMFFYTKLTGDLSSPSGIRTLGSVLALVYLALALIMTFVSQCNWRRLLYLSSLMVIFTVSSYPYTTIYIVIPFLFFLKETKNSTSKADLFYAFCFGLFFTILALPAARIGQAFGASFAFLLRYFILYPLILIAMGHDLITLKNKK